MELVVLGIGALLMVLVVALIAMLLMLHRRHIEHHRSTHRQQWTAIARELGLTFDPRAGHNSYGMIEGVYQGVWVRIDVYHAGEDNSHTYTRVRSYHHPELNLRLDIRRETSLGTLSRALGIRDIETGDAQFDDAFHVEGNAPDTIVRMLDRDVRRHILSYVSHIGPIQIDDRGTTGRIRGRATHTAHVLPLVQAQVGLVLAIRRSLSAAQVEDPELVNVYAQARS